MKNHNPPLLFRLYEHDSPDDIAERLADLLADLGYDLVEEDPTDDEHAEVDLHSVYRVQAIEG